MKNEKHVPFALRGDAHELPHFTFDGITKNSEASKAIKEFARQCVDQIKMREEMRLAYVAVTRARTHLLCTTSWWRDGANSVSPSNIFTLIAEAHVHLREVRKEHAFHFSTSYLGLSS